MRSLALLLLSIFRLNAQQPAAEFEVASVKPHLENPGILRMMTISGTTVRLQGYTVPMLVDEAWNVKRFQMSLSDEVKRNPDVETYYDIEARVAGDKVPSTPEVKIMLQKLLAERFHVKVHRSTKELPVYGLVIAKNGPKLKESAPDTPCSFHMGPSGRNYVYKIVGCPIQTVVEVAENLVSDRPITEKTGLTGKYDVTMTATPDFISRNGPGPDDISPFSALQDLGLRLESMKAEFEILNLDSFEKPAEN